MGQGEGEKKQKYWGLKWSKLCYMHSWIYQYEPQYEIWLQCMNKTFFQKLMKWHQQNSTIQDT